MPAGLDARLLPRQVRAELRSLPRELADIVAAHLVAAGQLVDEQPDLAYAHAEAARRRAARLPIVREAAAETAYAAGKYDVALGEFRALRRMTGTLDFLPAMADCERALGRPQAALRLAQELRRSRSDVALQAEMVMVEAGARTDLGQRAEALRLLSTAVAAFAATGRASQAALARLRYAYADALLAEGRQVEAHRWFGAAADLDVEGVTDARERADELDGLVIDFDPDDDVPDDDVPKDDGPGDDEPDDDVPDGDER